MKGHIYDYDMSLATTLSMALKALKDDPTLRPFAGGTDLMVLFEAGKLQDKNFLGISHLPELQGIEVLKDEVVIHSMTTFREIRLHPIIAKEFPMLTKAANLIGAIAIQNLATLGGNIANASAAADSPIALLCYEAKLKLVSDSGERDVDYQNFHLDYKKIDLRPAELIKSIHLPRAKNSQSFDYYHKVGTRLSQAITKVGLALRVELSPQQKVKKIKIALTSVAPYPKRALNVEEFLTDQKLTPALIEKAQNLLKRDIAPIDDIRSTKDYRLKVAQNLLAQGLFSATTL